MIGKHILEATVAAREEFESGPSISLAMTWAYNVSRLVLVRKDSNFNTDLMGEVDSEITAYIQYKCEKMYSKTEVIEILRGVQSACNNTSWYNGDSEINYAVAELKLARGE